MRVFVIVALILTVPTIGTAEGPLGKGGGPLGISDDVIEKFRTDLDKIRGDALIDKIVKFNDTTNPLIVKKFDVANQDQLFDVVRKSDAGVAKYYAGLDARAKRDWKRDSVSKAEYKSILSGDAATRAHSAAILKKLTATQTTLAQKTVPEKERTQLLRARHAYVRELRAIAARRAESQKAGDGDTSIYCELQVRTYDTSQAKKTEQPNYYVWYMRDADYLLDKSCKDQAVCKRFKEVSSATTKKDLKAGNYWFWTQRTKGSKTHRSKPTYVEVMQKQDKLDLEIPEAFRAGKTPTDR